MCVVCVCIVFFGMRLLRVLLFVCLCVLVCVWVFGCELCVFMCVLLRVCEILRV